MHERKVVQYLKDGHSSSFRHPLYSPYPSAGHLSAGCVVSPHPLLFELRLLRAPLLSTSRECNKVHVEDDSHRKGICPTSGSLALHQCSSDRGWRGGDLGGLRGGRK